MPVEAAARCDSSPFAWLQPPVLISPAAYWCTSQRPSSSPFPASTTRNPNDDLSRPPRTVAHLAICIQDAHPETAVPSAFFPAANCPPVASALGRSARPLILPLATSYLANCSLMVWENGLCFNRASRIQETSLNTLCWPARTRGLLGVRETVRHSFAADLALLQFPERQRHHHSFHIDLEHQQARWLRSPRRKPQQL
jgi:hypothetical protein